MKLILDIPEDVYKKTIFYREFKDLNDCVTTIKALENATPIPDNATNGDVVKSIFTNTFDNFCERTTWEWNRWWNAPYQKGGKE